MIKRWMVQEVRRHLAQMPAVALLGARQVGKTTLARELAESAGAIYLDLETAADALRMRDPAAFLQMHSGRLVILDEVQRMPDLFVALRGVIDRGRAAGRRAGQLLLLGSASPELLRQSSESLAGRIRYLELGGLNALEVGGAQRNLQRLWLRGGFPDAWQAHGDDAAMDWLEDFIRTFLERDVPQLGFAVPAARLRRLWTMLAHLHGETINLSNLARNLEVQRAAVNHYLDILEGLLLVRRLQPWHANTGKRLVKSPRHYIRDSGILHRLLGVESRHALLAHPVLGKSWEGFVMENIHSVLPRRARTFFYRTAAGAEMDLVIKMPSGDIWAVEIKHGTAPKPGRHHSRTCADLKAARRYMVYGGDDEFPIGDDTTAISLPGLMARLQPGRA